MIFGRNRLSRRNLSFQKFSNERKIIESIEPIDSIERSIVSIGGRRANDDDDEDEQDDDDEGYSWLLPYFCRMYLLRNSKGAF